MPKFIGETCTVCKKAFAEKDDIVVCPVCGTPHHRECWFEGGDCVNKERHGEGFVWKAENSAAQSAADSRALGHICPVCGENNPPDNLFCENCGQPRDVRPEAESKNPYAAYIDPFKGVEIDGVSGEKMAQFINSGAYRYVPKFASKKHGGWNWGAFFLGPFWFFFRKLTKIGAVLLIISMSLGFMFTQPVNEYIDMTADIFAPFTDSETGQIRTDITEAEFASAQKALNEASRTPAAAYTYAYCGLTLAMNIFCAAFANRFYRNYCVKNVKELEAQNFENPLERALHTARKGGISFFGLFGALMARSIIIYIVTALVMTL